MTQEAKQQAFVKRPVPRTTGATLGFIDLFGGDQQTYAQLPVPGTGSIAYGSSNLLRTDPHFTTTSSSAGAWATQNVAIVTTEGLEENALISTPDLLTFSPLSSRVHIYRSGISQAYTPTFSRSLASHTLNEKTLATSAVTVRKDLHLYQTKSLGLVPAGEDLVRVPNYEGSIGFLGGTISTQNSVTQLDKTAEEVIWEAYSVLRIPERRKLTDRLLEIQKEIQEENDPSYSGISISSLSSFLRFLKSNEDLRCPTVSASPPGNIYASWKREGGYVFSIHFLQEDNVRFVLFRPNEKHAHRMIRISGTATADIVLDIVRVHGIRTWAYR